MKQKRQQAPQGEPQRITKAVTHIPLSEANPDGTGCASRRH
jgi:hypothetical protein